MLDFIRLFFPSALGTLLIVKNDKKIGNKIFYYMLINVLSNLSVYLLGYYIKGVMKSDGTSYYFVKFVLLSLAFSLFYAFIISIIRKTFEIKVIKNK